jgi:threonine dehydrogenase-like Zn-dependent dehydrogenase
MDGGFAEYASYMAGKVFKIHNLSDVDATLLEPYVLLFSLCNVTQSEDDN